MRLVVFTYERNLGLEGHETLCVDHTTPNLVETVKAFNPDMIIEREFNDGQALYSRIYKQLPYPKAYWVIDAHTDLVRHINYAKQFDYVFCAQSWFIPLFTRETLAQVFYLPLCHTQTLTAYEMMLAKPVSRDIEFSFIGNLRSIHVERIRYVRKFLEMMGDGFFARQSDYDQTLEYLRRSKVTFNCSLNNDLNFRVWESIACGAGIVTDSVEDIQNINGLGSFLTLYDKLLPDFSVLQNPVFRYGAEEFIKSGHTLTHRYMQMLEMAHSGKQYEYA